MAIFESLEFVATKLLEDACATLLKGGENRLGFDFIVTEVRGRLLRLKILIS